MINQNRRFRPFAAIVLLTLSLALVVNQEAVAQSGGRGMSGPTPSGRTTGGSMFGSDSGRVATQGLSLTATDEVVADIRVEGNRTVPASRITAQMQTRIGRAFDQKILNRDIRKLASMPWFVDVQPRQESTPKGRVITLRIVERATIRYIEYLGNAKLKDKRLSKETNLKVGAAVDPYAVEEGRRSIERAYRDSGYARATVTILEGNKPSDKGVVYVINEGVPQKIWAVEFEGNDGDFASDGRLKTKIKSKPGILRLFGGKLRREQLDSDIEALTAYYRSFGYFQARVGRMIEFDDEGKWATIKFVVHEGPRYQVRNVTFQGNKKFGSESLSSGVKLVSGELFERAKITGDVEWLKQLYGSQGHVFADVKAETIFLEEPGQIDLVYNIEEGKSWKVGRIFVHIDGENPHTRIQTALNRISIRPGEVMDIRELRASERRLQASSLFLADAARGIAPRITYQIPELQDTEFLADGSEPKTRGQSPTPPPSWGQRVREAGRKVYESFRPISVEQRDSTDGVDVHIVVGSQEQPKVVDVSADLKRLPLPLTSAAGDASEEKPSTTEALPHTAKRHTVYRQPSPTYYAPTQSSVYARRPVQPAPQTIFRGQSPAGGYPATQAYQPPAYPSQGYRPPPAATPVAPAANGYGGQVVRAATPAAAPPGYSGVLPNQTSANTAQQVQFQEPVITPNAGTLPPITPIPPTSELFPDGRFGSPYGGYPDELVDVHVNVAEGQTGRFMVGVGVNSDAGVVGQIMLDERNFDWRRLPTSWRDFTDGTAFRGAGQRFRLEAAPGTEVQRYLASFQEPYLWDTPISFGLSGSYYDRRFRDWDEQRLGLRTSLGYQWTQNDLSASLSYRYENIKITDPASSTTPDLNEVITQDNNLHGFGLRITNDTRNNPFLATEGHLVDLQLEQVVGTFDYPRAILEGKKYFLLRERPDHSGRHVLVGSSKVGWTGSNTPIYEHFFAGGYSTLRGFDFRGASPVFLDGAGRNVQVGGEFMWVNTVEYLFPITADDMIHGVAFCDFGTVESSVEIEDFRIAPGFGLRITVPAMGPAPIALDFAFPINDAEFDDNQVFTFNVGFLR